MIDQLRIAMWSGPRNISTAMMRSWGNRPDTFVCDEPFYAYYLKQTGLDHPMAAEIISTGTPDWHSVADWLTGEIPEGKVLRLPDSGDCSLPIQPQLIIELCSR